MSIALSWNDTCRTILVATFAESWTLRDYQQMVVDGAKLINAESHIVHVIYDFTATLQTTHQFLKAGRHAEENLPKNQGIVVFVGADVRAKAALGMGWRANLKCTQHVILVNTLGEALACISEHHNLSKFARVS